MQQMRILLTGNYTIAAWGDSITSGNGGVPYPAQLGGLSGDSVFNGGMTGYRTRKSRQACLPNF